jgi:hypothetical protein
MHITNAWPDGKPTYERIGWRAVSASKLLPNSSFAFRWVNDVYINDERGNLTRTQGERKQAIIDAIFALPKRFHIRVHLGTKAPTNTARDGKTRSIEAATFGFLIKLGYLRRLHHKICKRL